MRSHLGISNLRSVRNAPHDVLRLTTTAEPLLLQSEIGLEESPRPQAQRDDALLAPRPERPPLPLDPELPLLPEDVFRSEGAEFGDAQAGIEKRPDNELLLGGLAGVREPIGLFVGERLARILAAFLGGVHHGDLRNVSQRVQK